MENKLKECKVFQLINKEQTLHKSSNCIIAHGKNNITKGSSQKVLNAQFVQMHYK